MNSLVEYRELLSDYEQGLYTNIELISKTLMMLGGGDPDIWNATPEWVKNKIKEKVSSVKENDEFVSFSDRTSDEIKTQLFSLKKWLSDKGELETDN